MSAVTGERREVSVGGRRIVTELMRPPSALSGPHLVFLHEGLGSIAMWRGVPAELATRLALPALLYDRLGHGRSDPPKARRTIDYLHVEALEVLPKVLAGCGVGRAILIGHSDGGSIALIHAAERPPDLVAVVTEAAHAFVEAETLAGIRAAVTAFETTDLPKRLARFHGEQTAALFRAWSEIWLSPPFAAWTIEDLLPRIAAPLLVLQGADDEYGTERQVETIMKSVAGPVEARIVPGCAHAPHSQAREVTLDLVERFLRRHVPELNDPARSG